jgi:uncharacterized membrane protein
MKSPLSDTGWSSAGWALALCSALALVVGAALLPFAGPGIEHAIRGGFQPLCHQLPDRSFVVDGTPLAVCHRCIGIYIGLALGALALPSVRGHARRWARHDRWVLLAAVLPAALDWGSDVAGLWSNTAGTRVATGLWLGLVVGLVFARSLALRRSRDATSRPSASSPAGPG